MIWEFKIISCFGRKMSSQSSNTQSFGQDFLPTPFPTVPSWDCPESEESQARARGTGTLCSSQAAVTLRPFFLHHLFFFLLFKNKDILLHNHSTSEQI